MSLKTSLWNGARAGSLDQYLNEISTYPLIDASEEARLAKGVRAGDPEALDKLVRSNLRFVVSVAKRYQNLGVPLADLINEGNVGLIRAARRFDVLLRGVSSPPAAIRPRSLNLHPAALLTPGVPADRTPEIRSVRDVGFPGRVDARQSRVEGGRPGKVVTPAQRRRR